MLISRAGNFHKHLLLRHFTICGDWGSTVLVWIVTGLLWHIPSGRIYWNLKLTGRCRLSSIWWLCGGMRWKSMMITLWTSRWMSFSSKFLTNRGLQIMKDNTVMVILFFLHLKSKARLFQQRGNCLCFSRFY